jgi:hypothetical protein
MQETTHCQVCHSADLKEVLNLGLHPLCDDLVPVGDARQCKEYPIEILLCPRCLTANQRYNVSQLDLFPETYHYRARFTQDVLNGMRQLVEQIGNVYGDLKGKKIIDIGCNDGSLLGFFKEKGAVTYGVEPTGAYKDIPGGTKIWNDYFGEKLARAIDADVGKMDFITFTNVFAHIEDFDDLIAGVKVLSHDKTKIVIENHYLGAVLEHNQFDTFYHEHPRTYSLKSFKFIADRLGMHVEHIEFPKRYGGNIRIVLGTDKNNIPKDVSGPDEKAFFEKFAEMNAFVQEWKIEKRAEIDALVRQNGPLLAKAFPGRAAILIKLLGLTDRDIAKVAEKPGSMKLGHYLPGTRIPIVSDDDVDFAGAKHILNLAWHIKGEISTYLKSKGFKGRQIDIL